MYSKEKHEKVTYKQDATKAFAFLTDFHIWRKPTEESLHVNIWCDTRGAAKCI